MQASRPSAAALSFFPLHNTATVAYRSQLHVQRTSEEFAVFSCVFVLHLWRQRRCGGGRPEEKCIHCPVVIDDVAREICTASKVLAGRTHREITRGRDREACSSSSSSSQWQRQRNVRPTAGVARAVQTVPSAREASTLMCASFFFRPGSMIASCVMGTHRPRSCRCSSVE